jgi:hypothetical protein
MLFRMKVMGRKGKIVERIELINSNWTDCAGAKGTIALRVGAARALRQDPKSRSGNSKRDLLASTCGLFYAISK